MKTYSSLILAVTMLVVGVGCKKKTPIPPPPPPPVTDAVKVAPPGATKPVVAEFIAEPASIERGQSATLRWSVTGSNDIVIGGGIGTVPANGNRTVRPTETTSYTLTANGPGGSTTATARVVVSNPPPPPAPVVRTSNTGTMESRVNSELKDALYDYDSNNIRDDARAILTANAAAIRTILADFPTATINVEGHCDERGSAEYNLGLGDRRATSARDFLIQLGVPAEKLKPISYGKERPQCTEASEGCFQNNRRAHFSAGQ